MQPKRMINSWKLVMVALLLVSVSLIAVARKAGWFTPAAPQQAEYNVKEELQALYRTYIRTDAAFDISGKIYLYDVEQKNALKEVSAFRNIKEGGNYYSTLAGQQTFLCNGLWMQVDSSRKAVTVVAVNPTQPNLGAGGGFPLEQYLSDTAAFKVSATATGNNTGRVLHLRNELTPEIKSVDVYYNPVGYTIKRMEVQWWKTQPSLQQPKEDACWLSVIQFTNDNKAPFSITEEMGKIIKPAQDSVIAIGKYKDYELTVSLDNAVTYP